MSVEPTLEEWRALYREAVAFRDLAPWEWMWDSDIFGIQDPESGEIGFCCVMGNLGEHFALGLYRGSRGLAAYWEMHLRAREPDEGGDPMQILLLQDCVMASFEDRKMLTPADLEVIKRLGLKFRGQNAWPQFRSYLPGYEPWYLTGEEARRLTRALAVAREVGERLGEDLLLLPNTRPGGQYLVRVPEKRRQGWEWKDTRQEAPPVPAAPERAAPPVDAERVRRLAETLPATDGVLELGYFCSPTAVKEEKDWRPYFPQVVVAADSESGMVMGVEMLQSGAVRDALVKTLLDILERIGMRPGRLLVSTEEAFDLLDPVARELGARLILMGRLGAVEALREGLSEFMGR